MYTIYYQKSRYTSKKHHPTEANVTNTTITLRDFKSFPNTEADLNLVDAPCSSEATIRKKNAVAKIWKEKDYDRFGKLQKGLLNKACEMTPSGSTILYSTCTFAPEENERVISEIIDNQPVKVENIGINGLKTSPGITEWNGNRYNK